MIWFGSFQLTNSGRTLLAGDAFTDCCRNTLLLLILFRTTGCQACFLKTIFEQPPAFSSPTVSLTAQDNSSCFDSLLWLHKSIFTAVLESILYSAFPQSQETGWTQFVLPGQQKGNMHGELLTIEDEDTSEAESEARVLKHGHRFSVYTMKKKLQNLQD